MNRSRSIGIVALALCVFVLGLAPSQVNAQAKLIKNLFSHVMKSAEVDAHFAKIQDSWDVYTKTNHAVTFRVATKNLPATNHQEADEYWFVRKGTAKVTLQAGATPASASVGGGDVVYVPRDVAYAIEPSARFEYVAVRVFTPRPPGRGAGAGRAGGAPLPEPTSYFATKAQIDKTFADEPRIDAAPFPRWSKRQHDHLQRRNWSVRIT